eukprot:366432-Chlamydomonas_euryale.AAC.21
MLPPSPKPQCHTPSLPTLRCRTRPPPPTLRRHTRPPHAPYTGTKLPSVQAVHVALPESRNVPGAHSVKDGEPAADVVPSGTGSHTVAPSVRE